MREYVVDFLVAMAVSYLLTVVAREIALRTGAVARVRDRDMHDEPIPYLGGLAMLGGLVAAYLVARELPFLSTGAGEFVFRDAGVVIGAGALICDVGVLDRVQVRVERGEDLGGQRLHRRGFGLGVLRGRDAVAVRGWGRVLLRHRPRPSLSRGAARVEVMGLG